MQARAVPNTDATPAAHTLILENRHLLTATGVTRIVSYDDVSAVLETGQGTLNIGGKELQVSELSIQSGQVKIYGQIDYAQYTQTREGGGFFRRFTR